MIGQNVLNWKIPFLDMEKSTISRQSISAPFGGL